MDDKTAQQAKTLAHFVWQIADTLRGDFKQSEYGKVILPFVVLRRLDCILEPSKEAVLKAHASLPEGIDEQTRDMMLFGAIGGSIRVYNTSKLTFASIKAQNPAQLHDNLVAYITGFSSSVKDVFLDKFLFTDQLKRLKEAAILWKVFEQFAALDLKPQSVSTLAMGYLFEDLIRRFSEISNETAGEHFTPREVIRLIVDLLLVNDAQALTGKGIIRQVYDPACGTGGMLALTEEGMKELNPDIRVELFGQELNGESFGICKSDMLVTGHDPEQIAFGNTLTHDAHKGRQFHYMLSNPPYGVDWKKYQEPIKEEAETKGKDGRFGAGLPRISDGQLLFLQHMISKMRTDEAGSRIGIVMNGSPLFTGGAGSGESEIRRWMLENDWVEAIVALPTDLFYNTGIQTYVWLLTNRKRKERHGKVQLIDASGERFWKPMRKNLGSKRREIRDDARETISRIFHEMANGGGPWAEVSKIFDTTDFGYREIKIERPLRLNFQASADRIERLKLAKPFLKLDPAEQDDVLNVLTSGLPHTLFKDRPSFEAALTKALKGAGVKIAAPVKKAILAALSERDETAAICLDGEGKPEPDAELRDFELVPLKEDWEVYVAREVTPFVPDAWVDETYTDGADKQVGRVGYEINFNRYFYRYVPPRPLAEIDAELKTLEADIANLLKGGRMSYWPSNGSSNLRPIKHLARFNPEVLPEDTDPDFPFDYIDIGGVTLEDGVRHKEPMRFETAPSRARKPVRYGDVIVSTVRTYLKAVARIDHANSGAVVSTGFAVLRPKAGVDAGYLYRVCQANPFVGDVEARSTGVGYPAINPSALAAIKVPLPNLDTQKAIARYLDRETARIDQLIARKERQVDLLNLRARQAVSAIVMGQGLGRDQTVATGLDYMPRIPAHWTLRRAGHVFQQSAEPNTDDLPVLSVSIHTGISDRQLDDDERDRKVTLIEDRSSYKRVRPGYLAYNMMRAWQGAVGVSTVEGAVSPAYVVAKPTRDLHSPYYQFLLRTPPFIEQMRQRSKGITDFRLRLYWEQFRLIVLPVPPLDEQKRIASEAEHEFSYAAELAAKVTASVDRLKERRAALITATVACHIEVRQHAPAILARSDCYSACNIDPLSWGIGVQNWL